MRSGVLADKLHAPGAQVRDRLGRGRRGHARGQVEQDPGAKPRPDRVRRGRVHAVVGGDAYHVDLVHPVPAQPVAQRRMVAIRAWI